MAKEIWQGEIGMGEGMCAFWFEPLQIDHLSEDKVHFNFILIFVLHGY
jgi:hypothetical protein